MPKLTRPPRRLRKIRWTLMSSRKRNKIFLVALRHLPQQGALVTENTGMSLRRGHATPTPQHAFFPGSTCGGISVFPPERLDIRSEPLHEALPASGPAQKGIKERGVPESHRNLGAMCLKGERRRVCPFLAQLLLTAFSPPAIWTRPNSAHSPVGKWELSAGFSILEIILQAAIRHGKT